MKEQNILIIGGDGQLGKALKKQYPNARAVDIAELDISDPGQVNSFDWESVDIILNAAAYTNVDSAETNEGRVDAWRANTSALQNIASKCKERDITVVHISTDYVFDGTKSPHTENEPFSPLNVYGASKAAGDAVVGLIPKHFILRTSWVIGDGKNFVRTMLELGLKGVEPAVVSDQIGRLTFTTCIVSAINHLLVSNATYGTYNISNSGEPVSWADVTREIFKLAGLSNTVTSITTAEYFSDKPQSARRPMNSTLDLSKIEKAGFSSNKWREDLKEYVSNYLKNK